MTDSDGKLIWKGRYDAWGSLIRDSYRETASDSHQPFRLQNQYFDEETGLHYNFFRYYAPVLGRFITQDPIGVRGGSNLYFFAPSAQMWSDSLGLSAVQVAKGVLSFIATDTAIVEPTDVAWPKWVAYGILAALAVGVIALSESENRNRTSSQAKTESDVSKCDKTKCPPCKPYPVGTLGYQGPEAHLRGTFAGREHYHIFEVQQNPNDCKCRWQKGSKSVWGHQYFGDINPSWINLNSSPNRPPNYPH